MKAAVSLLWVLLSLIGALALAHVVGAVNPNEKVNGLWLVVAAACIYVLAYRFYGRWLALTLQHRAAFVVGFLLFVSASGSLFAIVGRDFFPSVDAGQIRLHMRAPTGTRIEETARLHGTAQTRAAIAAFLDRARR